MSEFENYEPIVPNEVQYISITVTSQLMDQLDPEGQPTGVRVDHQGITITANVTDSLGNIIEENVAVNNRVVDIGLITQAQADQLQALLTELRATAESRLLPQP